MDDKRVADRFQTERFEEKVKSDVRWGTRAGHGRSDEGMVFTTDPRDISRRIQNVRVLRALAMLLVQHRADGPHEPPRIQSHRRTDGPGRVQFHYTGSEFSGHLLQETIVAAGRAPGQ